MARSLRLPNLAAALMVVAAACSGADTVPFAEPVSSLPAQTTSTTTTLAALPDPAAAPGPGAELPAAAAALSGAGECADPAGDLASEPTGFPPPIPWASGDIATARAGMADGVLGFIVQMPMAADPQAGGMITGGPGPTPLQFDALLAGTDRLYRFQLYRALDEQQVDTTVYLTVVETAGLQTLVDAVPVGQSQVDGWTLYSSVDASLVEGLTPGDWTLDFRSTWGPVAPLSAEPLDPEVIVDYGCPQGAVFRIVG